MMTRVGAEALCGSRRGPRDRFPEPVRASGPGQGRLVRAETEEEVEAEIRRVDEGAVEEDDQRLHQGPASFL